METPLPPTATPPGDAVEPAAKTDGLAAAIAAGPATSTVPAPARNVGGRPPTHGLYSKAAGSNGKNPVKPAGSAPVAGVAKPVAVLEAPTEAPPRVAIPADLLSRVVKEALTLTENTISNAIEGKAKGAGLTAEEIAPQMKQARLGEDRKQLLAELAPYIAQEHGLDPELSPTLAASLILGPWAFGAYTSFATLATLAKERAEREKESKPAKPA